MFNDVPKEHRLHFSLREQNKAAYLKKFQAQVKNGIGLDNILDLLSMDKSFSHGDWNRDTSRSEAGLKKRQRRGNFFQV